MFFKLYMTHMKAVGTHMNDRWGALTGLAILGLLKSWRIPKALAGQNRLKQTVIYDLPALMVQQFHHSFPINFLAKILRTSLLLRCGRKHLVGKFCRNGQCLCLVDELLLLQSAGMLLSFLHPPLDSSCLSNARHNLESMMIFLHIHKWHMVTRLKRMGNAESSDKVTFFKTWKFSA